MIKNKIFITLIFILTIFLSVKGQENLFKDFAENHKQRAFCLYPSTLRMLNISDNTEINNVVDDIKKLLIYKLDSISIADKLYRDMINNFKSNGFEEYISIYGGNNEMYLLSSPEKKHKEYVGIIIQEDITLAFFMKGDINWEEIPKILNGIKEGNFINILDLNLAQFE
ncbi:MAG: DUF4252 domain-containing protein [Bacteroidales bacterium]|nr:DUF4252 domain-containing protein [Bacteroidales bacterium]